MIAMFFKNKKIQLIFVLVAAMVCGLIGFYLGRKTVKEGETHTEIVYVEGETIIDSIPYPVPQYVIKPTDTADIIRKCVKDGIYAELFPERIATEYVEIMKEDTAEIIKDWGTKRMYSETLFDSDTVGKCVVDASVQYNRLSLLSYSYTPITKTVTITERRVKFFSPYVGVGALLRNDFTCYTNVIPSVNGGFFIKEKFGLNIQYGKDFGTGNNLYGVSLQYKF
jgi:hypothetical protein